MRNLDDLFSVIIPYDQRPGDKSKFTTLSPDDDRYMRGEPINGNGTMLLGHYMTIDGGGGMELPYQTAWVAGSVILDIVKNIVPPLVFCDYDAAHFNLIIFDTEAHLWLRYAYGSRDLGTIDLRSLPDWIKTKPDTD